MAFRARAKGRRSVGKIQRGVHSEPPSAAMVSEKAPFAPYRLHRTLVGHAGSVAAVKFSPDGQWLATASADATCRLWRLADGHCAAVLTGHTGGLSDVCWSAGSDYVATGSDDKLLALWRVPSGERVLTYTGHTAFVFCCTFNPQSNLLASGSFDETVRLWEARTGRCLAVLPAHSDPVTSVAFSHDGTLLVSGSYDGACVREAVWCLPPRLHVVLNAVAAAPCVRLGAAMEPAGRGVHADAGPGRSAASELREGACSCSTLLEALNDATHTLSLPVLAQQQVPAAEHAGQHAAAVGLRQQHVCADVQGARQPEVLLLRRLWGA